jgi:hypothetical protein
LRGWQIPNDGDGGGGGDGGDGSGSGGDVKEAVHDWLYTQPKTFYF